MPERRYLGRSASPGLVIGPLVRAERQVPGKRPIQGSPAEEETSLRAAMSKAGADLEALAAVASGDGADILAFQIAMLEDPALIEDVLVEIAGGQGALPAWQSGLQAEIEGYQAAADDYFRARASDLDDLKDRVGRVLTGTSAAAPDLVHGAILLDHDLTPSRFLGLDVEHLGGLALVSGSSSSHVAMLARARGVAMIVGIGGADDELTSDDQLTSDDSTDAVLDADTGLLVLAPTSATRRSYQAELARRAERKRAVASERLAPARTADGERIEVMVNIDHPDAVDDETLLASDGVGLFRTEFLFLGRPDFPSEDEQYQAYIDLLDRLEGKPVTIRTLDIGGDKSIAGLNVADEANPFLGLRGIRLCLDQVELFRPQLRALLRASIDRPIRVMLPMVTVQAEIDAARGLMEACQKELHAQGIAAQIPPLGIMVETPAAAIAIDRLDAAFYSIGSNDLIQYVMAASRDAGGRVSDLLDPAHPAIERLIEQVARHGRVRGLDVSLCGDMASDPAFLPLLLRSGLRKISVAPAMLDGVKQALGDIDLKGSFEGA